MFLAEIFGRSATFSAKYPHLKFQNLKKFWAKIPKFDFFFFKCGWKSVKMSENQKKILSRSISPFKALEVILGSKMILNGPKWILKRVHIFQMSEKIQKKIQIFGKDFNVKNAEKKIQQKKFFNFFRKKYFFDFFLILFFFMGNRQIK